MDKTIKLACLLAMVILVRAPHAKILSIYKIWMNYRNTLWSRNMKPSSIGMTD